MIEMRVRLVERSASGSIKLLVRLEQIYSVKKELAPLIASAPSCLCL
jgi:hypothetical protein